MFHKGNLGNLLVSWIPISEALLSLFHFWFTLSAFREYRIVEWQPGCKMMFRIFPAETEETEMFRKVLIRIVHVCRHVWGQQLCLQCQATCNWSKANHVEQDCSSLLVDSSGGWLMSASASSFMSKCRAIERVTLWNGVPEKLTVSQEILCRLWKPQVHHHVHKNLWPVFLLSQMNQAHTVPSYLLKIILYYPHVSVCPGLPSGLFFSGFPSKMFYEFVISSTCATCPIHLILLIFIILIIFGKEYLLQCSLLFSFLQLPFLHLS